MQHSTPYDLTLERRHRERRRLAPNEMGSFHRQGALLLERRRDDRRRNDLPLEAFPWLPHNCC
ncbi:hypothetical protein AAIA72_02690 [Hahella sp. SMD15-11]|uniref:Uncharacterized protein n=1 Tax=Thermohahella caldifontis TaxID=3142973 RepID=A0AB39UXZ3_9GAMM